ncbi:MAG: glycosyltransferase family 87 protein [Chloroflexota bacterium]
MSKLRLLLFSFLFLFLLLLFAFLVPLPIPPYLDFQVLYHADLGLTQGIALYDRVGQAEMIARLAGVTPEQVFVLPFPYPPWYALSTLFLAWPPVEIAARLWFGLNLSMLLASIWLLTDGWKPAPRLASFLIAIVFIPVIGSLYVGQFIFPVLLGASLMTFALRRENVPLTALAAALLTFKPHLGGPLAAAVLITLFLRRDDFSRRAVRAILLTGVFLFAIGFLADPAWPLNYLHSLLGFRDVPGVSSCGLCASLPVGLVAILTGQTDIGPSLPLGVVLFVILFAALIRFRREMFRAPAFLVAASLLVTLLADPYLLNYDFALLLVPLFILASSARRADWPWLALAYLLPSLLLGLFGRGGNLYLSIPALLLLSLQIARAKPIDGSPRKA